jgi:hypothetical protein
MDGRGGEKRWGETVRGGEEDSCSGTLSRLIKVPSHRRRALPIRFSKLANNGRLFLIQGSPARVL